MEENAVSQKQENDPLESWKGTSALILSVSIAVLCCKAGLSYFISFLILFPIRRIFCGFFDNKIQSIVSGILTLILLWSFSGSMGLIYGKISGLTKGLKAAEQLAQGGTYVLFFILFLIIIALAGLIAKVCPEQKIPKIMHQSGMIIIFSFTLFLGLIAVGIGLNYLNGRFISFPPQLSFWLPFILGLVGVLALIKMVKNVLAYDCSDTSGGQKGNLSERPQLTLDDVAGMEAVKEQIRLRMIEPVRNPAQAKKYGLKKGGGVLLYGPPGTGKTFIARAVAGELSVPFYMLNASDIYSRYVGDSEKKIKEFFENVRKNPLSVVFVDEMEIIFAKRTDNVHEVTQKVISIILQELDGINQNKNPILLLGATNTPWKIDEAFLRPGRFDILAFVDLPALDARKQIIKANLKHCSIEAEKGLIDYLAEKTENFSGADLNGLTMAIRQQAFDRKEKIFTYVLTNDVLKNISPSNNHDLMKKITEWQRSHGDMSSSARKTLLSERPDIRMADVAGMDDVKKQIRLRMIEPMKNPELAEKYGLQKGGGLMLYGPPGTGKTFIAKAVAGELDLPFYSITAADIFSKNVGESEQNIRNIFADAGKNPMSVIFVDEMETIFSSRSNEIHEVTQKVISVILQELDGINQHKNPILLIGATNTPWKIDEAFLRPGRFDILAFVGLPDIETRKQILQAAFRKGTLRMEEGLIEYIAENTETYSGADLNGLVSNMRQMSYENRDDMYTLELAYNIMLNNRPTSKREILTRIREWEKIRN